MGELGGWADSFAVIQARPGGRETMVSFWEYVGKVSQASDERMAEFMATMNPEVAETFVSTWDRVAAEGRNEGRAEGHAELLSWQLELRFGDLGEEVLAAVRAASTEQIAAWSARLIDGTLTLGDVTS